MLLNDIRLIIKINVLILAEMFLVAMEPSDWQMAIDLHLLKVEWKYVMRATGRRHVIIIYIAGEVVKQQLCVHNLDTPVQVLMLLCILTG